jgi:hypothetical protein
MVCMLNHNNARIFCGYVKPSVNHMIRFEMKFMSWVALQNVDNTSISFHVTNVAVY